METIGKNLDALSAFQAVAIEKSFTKAAETLGKSKSFLSKQIMMLETYLGITLFFRTTRTLSLTQEGRALLNYSEQIFKLSDDAEKHLKGMSNGMIGQMRISAPVSLGLVFFPAFFKEASKMLPLVRFDSDLSNDNRDFSKDQIDFAVRATKTHSPEHRAIYLGRIQDVVCAAPVIAKKVKDQNDPCEIESQDCILYSHDPDWNIWNLNSEHQSAIKVRVKGKYSVNMYEAARSLCLNGYGIARIPRYSVTDELKQGKLVELLPKYKILSHPLYLVYPKSEYSTQKHKITKDLIVRWFKDQKTLFV